VDTIDVAAATELGVVVANVPNYCVEEVADHTIALLLACARKLVRLDDVVRGGVWDHKGVGRIHRLRGQVLGLIGFGKIARQVARRAQALRLVIRCHDPWVDPAECEQLGVERVDLASILADSDFVSLHVPLNDETRHLIGEREFAAMKPSAFLINAARGGLVDQAALRRALEGGQIAGAGIDLLDEAIPFDPGDPLLRLPNLVITPHAAWYSVEAVAELQRTAAEEVARVLRGERPLSMVNPEVWERARLHRLTTGG
jgi:D-3-phosphoglycerate dehydrogenase